LIYIDLPFFASNAEHWKQVNRVNVAYIFLIFVAPRRKWSGRSASYEDKKRPPKKKDISLISSLAQVMQQIIDV
jgi:hypothetical protein